MRCSPLPRRSRVAGALAVSLAAGALAATSAQAATYCVLDSACSGTKVGDLQSALDLAKAGGDDRIELGQQTFERPGGYPANVLAIGNQEEMTVRTRFRVLARARQRAGSAG